jgi:hypothetical protein
MATALAAALDRQDYSAASTAAGYLVNYRRNAGRLGEALQLTDNMAEYTRQAGFGPWTQLSDQVQRLQILNVMGQGRQVLDEVERLREQMGNLPAGSSQPEGINPWNVRELLLDTGRSAASQLGRWAEALELSAAAVASMRGRGAPDTEIAGTQFNDYGPLLGLGRLDDAVALLITCREIFERAHDIQALGKVLGALADAEDKRNHGEVAIGLERDALRYLYLAAETDSIQVSHHNLGNYLRGAGQPRAALAHHLASALLCVVTGAEGAGESARAAAADLRAGGEAAMPADTVALCGMVGEVPGVRLDRLLAALAPDSGTVDQVLRDLADRVRAGAAAAAAPPEVAQHLAAWDPVIAGLAAARGNSDARTAVREYLAGYTDSRSWAGLAAALTRILDGQHGEDLATGLDDIDTAIISRALGAVAGQVSVPKQLWPAMSLGPLLGDITAAARGDSAAARRARPTLDQMAGVPELAGLAGALEQILGGSRDPGLAEALDHPTEQAVVACVLEHVGAGIRQQEEGT